MGAQRLGFLRTLNNEPIPTTNNMNENTTNPQIASALEHAKIAKRVVQWVLQRKRSDDDRACYIDGMRDAGVKAKAVEILATILSAPDTAENGILTLRDALFAAGVYK